MVSFKIDRKKLISTLKLFSVSKKRLKKDTHLFTVEITITDNNIKLTTPGAIFNLESQTKGTAKFAVPYNYFVELLKNLSSEIVEFNITENYINVEDKSIMVKTTFFEDDTILRSINLPLNYTLKDLLLLPHQGYTKEELDFNNITILIKNARKKVVKELKDRINISKKYGIHVNDIKKLLNYSPHYNSKGQLFLFNIDEYIIDDL